MCLRCDGELGEQITVALARRVENRGLQTAGSRAALICECFDPFRDELVDSAGQLRVLGEGLHLMP